MARAFVTDVSLAWPELWPGARPNMPRPTRLHTHTQAAFSMLATLAMGANQWDASSLEDMSIAQLSGMLQQRGARCVGCVEKEDFLAKLRELEVEDEMAPATRGSSYGCAHAVQTWTASL